MKPLCLFSLMLNGLFILLLVFSLSRKTAFVSIEHLDGGCVTGICAVSIPEERSVVFSPVELSLKAGEEAALQYSAWREGKQLNIAFDPLYDRDVLSVEQTAWGLFIKALKPGEAALQTLTPEGIRDIAVIEVSP